MKKESSIKRTVLDNGVVVISENLPGYESAAVGLYIKSGSRHEGEKHNGLAHFFEHIVFKGTERRSALELAASVEEKGGQFNAYTSTDHTCFFAHTAASELMTAVDTICEMINSPKIDPVGVKNEKEVILEEVRANMDHPDRVANELYMKALWGWTELGRPVAGTVASVKRLGVKDLEEYHTKVLYESPMVVVASGKDVNHSELVKAVRKGLSRKTGIGCVHEGITPFFKSVSETKHMAVNQACVRTGTLIPTNDDRLLFTYPIVRHIMGGGMTSRLFRVVREEMGLVYGIWANLDPYVEGVGFTVGYKAEPKKAAKAFEAIRDEIASMKRIGFSKDDIRKAKDALRGQASLSYESALERMMLLGERELDGKKMIEISAMIRRTESITAKDVDEAIEMISGVDEWAYGAVVPNGWRGKIRK